MTDEHFRQLAENCGDILTIRDADARIRYTSPAFERLLGYSHEEMIGKTGFDLLHPDDHPRVMTALHVFMQKPGARESLECRARHANGSWVSFEIVAHNMLDDPQVRGLVISGRDISLRKRDEAEKDQLLDDLQQALTRTQTLNGVLPICASCKKIRDDSGEWEQIESFIRDRTQVEFSHGMCPECMVLWFPDESGSSR